MNNSDIALFVEGVLYSLCKQHLLTSEEAEDLKKRIIMKLATQGKDEQNDY